MALPLRSLRLRSLIAMCVCVGGGGGGAPSLALKLLRMATSRTVVFMRPSVSGGEPSPLWNAGSKRFTSVPRDSPDPITAAATCARSISPLADFHDNVALKCDSSH